MIDDMKTSSSPEKWFFLEMIFVCHLSMGWVSMSLALVPQGPICDSGEVFLLEEK